MAEILRLAVPRRRARRRSADPAPCTIILFPGVRYERPTTEEGADAKVQTRRTAKPRRRKA